MTDRDLPEPVLDRLLTRYIAFSLCRHERYETYDAALADSEALLSLHREGRSSLVSFRKRRLHRLEKRYEEVTGESIADGLEQARTELGEAGHSLRVLCPWLL